MNKHSIILLLIILPFFAAAQNITLKGNVKDSIGKPVETANVIAVNTATQSLDAFSITNSQGLYKLQLKKGDS